MIRLLAGVAASVMCSMSLAQDSYTVEDVAQVGENETARFLPASVREWRGELLFDIVVRYSDPADVPVGGIASRTVTYRARCEGKEMSISVIELRDVKGRTTKMITVPPGAEEYFKPAAGSREDDWLYRVCG